MSAVPNTREYLERLMQAEVDAHARQMKVLRHVRTRGMEKARHGEQMRRLQDRWALVGEEISA